jgi:predicted ribosomally synthesized peptide with nif11-like leader
MSTDAVVSFLRGLEENAEFKDRCRAALEAEGPHAVVELAAEKGWEFTVEEFAEHVGRGDELDNDALEKVAGGTAKGVGTPRVIRGAFTRILGFHGTGMADVLPTEE